MSPVTLASRQSEMVVVLRREYGAITCHVLHDGELDDLLRTCGRGVELRLLLCQGPSRGGVR